MSCIFRARFSLEPRSSTTTKETSSLRRTVSPFCSCRQTGVTDSQIVADQVKGGNQ